ncbi:hypothetical protein SAMN04488696_0914 [Methanolobus profundi]|uniref:Uncharacterized protein n=1 Tax=Methanolobus profundi TaxID=487685 RepID=A0A1I4PVH3_9EURY|nr:hypothetical protein SAMN04488696_0914 [Methanolobus profundi]
MFSERNTIDHSKPVYGAIRQDSQAICKELEMWDRIVDRSN